MRTWCWTRGGPAYLFGLAAVAVCPIVLFWIEALRGSRPWAARDARRKRRDLRVATLALVVFSAHFAITVCDAWSLFSWIMQ